MVGLFSFGVRRKREVVMAYFLYILYSQRLDRYYVGITSDVARRLTYHNQSPKGWTRRGRPWHLVFKRPFPDKKIAQGWECWLKRQKRRPLLEKIIAGEFDWREA